jgi:hypothetical protein
VREKHLTFMLGQSVILTEQKERIWIARETLPEPGSKRQASIQKAFILTLGNFANGSFTSTVVCNDRTKNRARASAYELVQPI